MKIPEVSEIDINGLMKDEFPVAKFADGMELKLFELTVAELEDRRKTKAGGGGGDSNVFFTCTDKEGNKIAATFRADHVPLVVVWHAGKNKFITSHRRDAFENDDQAKKVFSQLAADICGGKVAEDDAKLEKKKTT